MRDSLLVRLVVSVLRHSMFLGGLLTALQGMHFGGSEFLVPSPWLRISVFRLGMLQSAVTGVVEVLWWGLCDGLLPCLSSSTVAGEWCPGGEGRAITEELRPINSVFGSFLLLAGGKSGKIVIDLAAVRLLPPELQGPFSAAVISSSEGLPSPSVTGICVF